MPISKRLDEVYKLDAYHSLSIEAYQVTPERGSSAVAGGAFFRQTSSLLESSA